MCITAVKMYMQMDHIWEYFIEHVKRYWEYFIRLRPIEYMAKLCCRIIYVISWPHQRALASWQVAYICHTYHTVTSIFPLHGTIPNFSTAAITSCTFINSSRSAYKPLVARFMGPTWGPSGADRTQVGYTLAPLTLLSGTVKAKLKR